MILSWDALRDITTEDVEMAAHSHTHPQMDRVPAAAIRDGPLEIASAQWADAQLGPGNTFATDEGDFAVNDEGHTTGYRLVMMRTGHVSTAWNVTLANGDTWQRTVPFNGKGSLDADLYRLPDLAAPYRYVDTNGDEAPGS